MRMQGICQVCYQQVALIELNQKQNPNLDDAAIHGESVHFVIKEHDDPHGEHCDGSLALPEKIVY